MWKSVNRDALSTPTWLTPRVAIAAAALVLLVAAVGVGGWRWYAAAQRAAATAFGDAMARLDPGSSPEPSAEARAAAARALRALLERYPSGAVVPQAAYELGNLEFAAQQYAQARGAYEIAVAKGSETLRTLARVGIAYTWEAERDFPKALEMFQRMLGTLKPSDFGYEDVLLDVARVQSLMGRKQDAIATYRRTLREVPQTRRADDIRVRLADLGAKPE